MMRPEELSPKQLRTNLSPTYICNQSEATLKDVRDLGSSEKQNGVTRDK